jgi:16S rRNA (adenine1518-N6/adenine1519-N6)-dimethyltransferase
MGYQTKKRFGQHFLHDHGVIDKIMAAAELQQQQAVVEIGPGLGVLTDELLEAVAQVEVMEIDRDLIERLEQRNEPRLTVHAGDVLKLDWNQCLTRAPYVLVANLPYNISSQIVFKLLEHRHLFSHMVLMFQREVGERLLAAPGSKAYGILSVMCQLWYDMRNVTIVKPGAFNPPPKVDSIVLKFMVRDAPRVDPIDETLFFKVVKGAFTQRRKTLRNSLQGAGFASADITKALEHSQISPGCRGETLTLEEFSRLTAAFKALSV